MTFYQPETIDQVQWMLYAVSLEKERMIPVQRVITIVGSFLIVRAVLYTDKILKAHGSN